MGSFKGFDTKLHTLDLLRTWNVVENGQPIGVREDEVSGGVVYGLGYRHTISKVLLQASYSQAQGGSDLKPSAGNLNFSLGYRF